MTRGDVWVTGASGFIGRALTAALDARELSWSGIARQPTSDPRIRALDMAARSDLLLTMLDAERPRAIFHLAGGSGGEDVFHHNIVPTRNLLSALVKLADYAPRIFSLGSAAEYGDLGASPIGEAARENPLTDYGIAKLAQSRLVVAARRSGVRAHVIRLFNVMGPGMPMSLAPARFCHKILAARDSGAREIQVGNLSGVRDYLEVKDAASALAAMASAEFVHPIVNLCSGAGIEMREILNEMKRQSGSQVSIRENPLPSPYDVPVSVGDATLLRGILGYPLAFDAAKATKAILTSAEQRTRGELR